MGSRLELKHGLVAEADRLSSSGDTLLVTEPATGSKARTKGNMYLVIGSGRLGGRARDATALVADTIQREYYYDESAGVPICLEKSIRSANRKLRSSREGNGMPPGSLGIAAAIVRGGELYVATIGDAEAYLVRAARLLMPDHGTAAGLPADDALRVDVWRGELAVGDSLLLVARNLTEVVGTEELKNAVVTLHPQSAVEHLHHLFVAAGGDGSDSVIAVEATELILARGDRRLAPAGARDAYGDMPPGLMPGSQQGTGAAAAVSGAFSGAAGAVTGAFGGAVDRVMDLMPRRAPSPQGITPQVSRRETQRRAAIALLALLGVVLVLGLLLVFFPRGQESTAANLPAGEQALAAARTSSEEGAQFVNSDPERSVQAYREAWSEIRTAEATGIPASITDPLEIQIQAALERLHRSWHPRATTLAALPAGANPVGMTRGPDRAAYLADSAGRQVWRVAERKPENGANVRRVVRAGDSPTPRMEGVGAPRLLARGGVDVLIVDGRGQLWRWRVAGTTGSGRLGKPKVSGGSLGRGVTDISTLLTSATSNSYNVYVTDPSRNQIQKYQPQLFSEAYSAPAGYLVTDNEDVASFLDTYIDGDLFTLTTDNVVKHESGIKRDYELQTPPDDADLRPGHDYLFLDGLGESETGRLYVYDQKWSRLLVFDKATGEYREQYSTVGRQPSMAEARGMYVYQPPKPRGAKPVVVWVTTTGVYAASLEDAPQTVPATGATTATPRPNRPTATQRR
jgi:hypothetical protein